jgi:ketosteroid isomerase-like protein
MTQDRAAEAILAQERRALDRWSQGEPLGYVDIQADEITYFDDIGAERRVDGIAAIREYLTSLEGKIPPHRYKVVDPKVQVYGDIGILTLRYEPTTADGEPLTPWKATSVYRRAAGEWRIVHAHWSLVKQA